MANQIRTSEIGSAVLDRRELLQGSMGLLGVVPLCCRSDEIPRESLTFGRDAVRIDLGKWPALRRVGASGAVVDLGRGLNLIVVHTATGSFVALDRSCTHGGAQCTYNPKRHTLRCTSLNHAEYELDGTLLHGRTHGNLRTYPVRLAGGVLEIGLERSA